ncbi:hypothetical protein Trco_002557 [Trichoderma cornu-damae]|uniref:DUF7721 domain-containing protein n=1 Tax=Trichoderma cornu-damae TaxID=654480 RepID=A0A9P8QQ50_9HYPO|nr:hypothetical protein Trco_002557 [Trichoderma cornu-damae]
MDLLMNAGKELLEQQLSGSGSQEAHGGNYPAGGDFYHEDEELRTAHQQASQHAGSSGNSDIFSSIINSIGQKKSHLANGEIDEQETIRKHKQSYEQDADNLDSSSLGAAAALQALKKFTQGETGSNQSQGAFLGLAMSEASKLFDSKAANGKVSSDASKESVIQQAGEMALKMYFKSQGSGQGGPSGLLGLASKFL